MLLNLECCGVLQEAALLCAALREWLLCERINISGTVPIYYCVYTLFCVLLYSHACCADSVLAICGCTYYCKTLSVYIKIGNGGVHAPRSCSQTGPMGTHWDILLLVRGYVLLDMRGRWDAQERYHASVDSEDGNGGM